MKFLSDIAAVRYILKKGFRDTISLIALFFAIVVLLYLLAFTIGTSRGFVEQTQHRQQAATRVGAASIEVSIKTLGNSLLVLSNSPELLDEGASQKLSFFSRHWSEVFGEGDILLTDSEGIVIASGSEKIELGQSFSDRDYFTWSQTAEKGEVFYGQTIISRTGRTDGRYIIPIATPIVEQDQFRGVLVAAFSIDALAECCLSSLKFDEDASIYLLDSNHEFIYVSQQKELIGKNVIDFILQNPFPGNVRVTEWVSERLEKGGEGKAIYIIPRRVGEFFPVEPMLVAYSPVGIDGQTWFLAHTIPYISSLSFVGFYSVRGGVFLVVSLFLLLVASIRFARMMGHQEAHKK